MGAQPHGLMARIHHEASRSCLIKSISTRAGSAPDISGKGIVNPVGTILSVAMMLKYSLALPKEAEAVERAVKAAIDNECRTRDIGGSASTTGMGDAVVAELKKILA